MPLSAHLSRAASCTKVRFLGTAKVRQLAEMGAKQPSRVRVAYVWFPPNAEIHTETLRSVG